MIKIKYKAEVLFRNIIQADYYFGNLSHPDQVARNVAERIRGRFSYFVIRIINEDGDRWNYSVMKTPDGKFRVRKMKTKYRIYTRDDLDMIFTGNKTIA